MNINHKVFIFAFLTVLQILPLQVHSKETIDFDYKFFQSFVGYIKKKYVEELDDQKLMEYALSGILSSLDPHSAYLDRKAHNEVKVATHGEFGGIGIEVIMEKGLLKVISPYEDTPAFKAGIQPQDWILTINGEVVKGMTVEEAGEKMRGAPGSKVNMKIYRESVGSIDLKIVREVIKIPALKAKILSDGAIAYLKVRVFNDKAAAAARKEYERMSKENPNIIGLILDLRWNPGGIFDQGKEMADLFLSEGDIVSIKGRDSKFNKVFKANAEDITHGKPIVVLINRGSASAAEIVAGALQDNKRALVVGMKSFGKGSVQEIIPLADGAAIKLTTALYYTPSGLSIQAQGITPDIIVPEAIVTPVDEEKLSNISEASLKGHLRQRDDQKQDDMNHPTIHSLMNLEEKKDFQLLRAMDAVKILAFSFNHSGSKNYAH